MTATIPPVTYWTVQAPDIAAETKESKFGTVRVSQVLVCAPFDTRPIVVRRRDGSLAYDQYNQFAALPSQIFKAPVIAAISRSGLCTVAVDASSSAKADFLVEAAITDLALTADADGSAKANVSLALRLLNHQRSVVVVTYGTGASSVKDGSYTVAFSEAFHLAIRKALADL